MWVSQNDFSDSKWLLCSRVYHNINGIGKSIVKICDFLLFFFSLLACRTRWNPIEAVSVPCRRSKKKKREHSSDTRIWLVVPIPVSDTDTTPKMACPCNLAQNSRVGRLNCSHRLDEPPSSNLSCCPYLYTPSLAS